MASFRDRFFTPRVARAITSPSAIVAAGAGAAAGVLIFANPIGAVALGAGAVAARVLAAVPRATSRPRMNPRQLQDPWRTFINDVLDADRRFATALGKVRPGPLKDRLADIGKRLDDAVDEAWRTATAGDELTQGRQLIDTERIAAELAAASGSADSVSTRNTVAALQAQLDSADRLDRTIQDVFDRLRLLDARIDETVTRTIELSVTQHDADELTGLGAQVDSVVSEMESLRQALQETSTR